MRILYVGDLTSDGSSCGYRMSALQRLGHDLIPIDTKRFADAGSSFARKLRARTLVGREVTRFNRKLLGQALASAPDLAWFDKATFVWPQTIQSLRNEGIPTVHWVVDNPFGPRKDPGWRLLMQAIPEYDVFLVPREADIPRYRAAGARDVVLMRVAYEPTVHFAPPQSWSDADRTIGVSFIGSPYDKRHEFIANLWRQHRIITEIRGGGPWHEVMSPEERQMLLRDGPVYGAAYRETIWRSRISLSFVTHSNLDEVAHRTFEIAACGGFMLAERTPGQLSHFQEGKEAAFFSGVEECAAQIRRYLPNPQAREEIAAAGRRRATSSGYSNDDRLRAALTVLMERHPWLAQRQTGRAFNDR